MIIAHKSKHSQLVLRFAASHLPKATHGHMVQGIRDICLASNLQSAHLGLLSTGVRGSHENCPFSTSTFLLKTHLPNMKEQIYLYLCVHMCAGPCVSTLRGQKLEWL